MSTLRSAVIREISRRKQSGYAFAKGLGGGTHPVTVMKWLYSGHRVSVVIVEKALAALDLVVVPRSKVQKPKSPKARKTH